MIPSNFLAKYRNYCGFEENDLKIYFNYYLFLDVWVSVSNQLQSADSELTVPAASYLTGLHGYRIQDDGPVQDGRPVHDGDSVVFLATDVGKHGAAVYKIENQNISRIYQGRMSRSRPV